MKSILVPTDFSECSASAYNYAALLANKAKATIYLLHVLDIPGISLAIDNGDENTADTHFMMEMMKLTKSRMSKVRSSTVFKDADVQEVIEVGSIPARIFDAVNKYKVDMIVMGTHGMNGFQEKFIGTNAEKVVRDVQIPVLSVKHAAENPKIDSILLATDFSKETEYVLPAISNIAELIHAKLILAKVITMNNFKSTDEVEKQIGSFREKSKVYSFSTQVHYAYDKEQGIRSVAEITGADMIALGTHGRHGLAHLFRGSIAENVVNHASLPVLTLNFHKKQMEPKGSKSTQKSDRKYDSDLLYQIPSV